MKKLLSLRLSWLNIIILATFFFLIFLWGIGRTSLVQAQETDNPGCRILSYYDKFDELNDQINALYARGYRLKEFFVQPVNTNTNTNTISNISTSNHELKSFAVLCKD